VTERVTRDGKLLCIIPAKGNSQRFPRKNLASFQGRPLVAQAIVVAQASRMFSTICVSSEDEEVLSVAKEYGADVALRRSEDLAGADAQVVDVCRSVVEYFVDQGQAFFAFAVLLPTSPLRTANDLQCAYQIMMETNARSCMSLVECEHPPQRAVCLREGHVSAFFEGDNFKQTQKLEKLYRHDGTVIFSRIDTFLRNPYFYGESVVPYFIERERGVDVDNPLDLAWAEFLCTSGSLNVELK